MATYNPNSKSNKSAKKASGASKAGAKKAHKSNDPLGYPKKKRGK